MPSDRLYDVIVVGAGLAGLAAAHQLVMAGKDVLLLEGTERAGGRIMSPVIEDISFNLGAQWISPSYINLIELTTLFGLKITKQPSSGQDFYADNGQKKYFDGLYPNRKLNDRINTSRLLSSLKKNKITDPNKPWLTKEADKLDQERFGHFLKRRSLNNRYYEMIRNIFDSRFLNGIGQVSALQALNNLQGLSPEKWYINGGTELIVKKLAQELDISYHRPVSKIKREGGILYISTKHQTFRARKVIVAIPPQQAGQIRYDPHPGITKERLWESTESGRIIKTVIAFEQPCWQHSSWSGQGFFSEEYLFNTLQDISHPESGTGMLTTCTIGSRCHRLETLNEEERKEIILGQVKKVLNIPHDLIPTYFLQHDWQIPPNGPGAFQIFPPGVLTKFADYINSEEGLLYWAASEYDPLFRGTMEGAVRSGRKAASQILGI